MEPEKQRLEGDLQAMQALLEDLSIPTPEPPNDLDPVARVDSLENWKESERRRGLKIEATQAEIKRIQGELARLSKAAEVEQAHETLQQGAQDLQSLIDRYESLRSELIAASNELRTAATSSKYRGARITANLNSYSTPGHNGIEGCRRLKFFRASIDPKTCIVKFEAE